MNRSSMLGSGLAVLCVIGLGGYFFLHPNPTSPSAEIAFPELSMNTAPSSPTNSTPRTVPADAKEYSDATYHFSVLYPNLLTMREYNEGAGTKTFVFQNVEKGLGFQIFVVPYKDSQITQKRFLEDEPSGIRTNITNETVGGVNAVGFYSQNPTLGDTREVWFIRGGYLFEVTAPKSEESFLTQILATWEFI